MLWSTMTVSLLCMNHTNSYLVLICFALVCTINCLVKVMFIIFLFLIFVVVCVCVSGTPATISQMAKDVSTFLRWAAGESSFFL